MTFLPDGHVAVAPGQRHAVAEAVTIWLSPAPIFFHVPDWHGGQCQSGVWKKLAQVIAKLLATVLLGSHLEQRQLVHLARKWLLEFVYALEGPDLYGSRVPCIQATMIRCIALISTNASNNPSYGKTAFISFAVPAGATYQITSYPAQNYSCGSGVFSVFGYQT
ncbi:prepilin, shufflon protein A [Escherichia coli]|nr:prepilin, shufflon protein A [Escherichia coli]CAK0689831.1 hypothetical protein FGAF404_47650 [Escherichia coli]